MRPLTDAQIRDAFVNTTVRETKQATLPDLESIRWDRIDYLGWRDPKRELLAYVVIDGEDLAGGVEGGPLGLLLRTQPPSPHRRRMMCAWCQDVTITDPAVLYVARRGGASGRKGDTVGTAVCSGFRCSENVRRAPSLAEMSGGTEEEKQFWIDQRIAQMRERVGGFVREVARTAG